jgi:hypothetical protein
MPFIPFLTVARAGGQPFGTIANYKVYYANGDFAGLDMYSTFTPDIKNHLAFVIVEDQLAGGNRSTATTRTSRGEDYAFIVSPEFTPFKGLDLKPMFSWFHADGLTASAARRGATNVRTVGGNIAGAAGVGGGAPAGDSANTEDRYTVGLDARWRVGPFGLDPTISYQWGSYESQANRTNGSVGKVTGDASAWLFDIIGSYQLGPLLLEMRGMYSSGNKARDNLSLSKRYYEPLDLDTGYWSGGWLGLLGLGVDYFNGGGGANQGMDTNIGYDRYGRGQVTARATYNITPALSLYALAGPLFTAQQVDTDTGSQLASAGGTGTPARTTINQNSWVSGDSNYMGTEANLGMTWRFSANTAFDLVGGYFFAGDAFDATECTNGAATCSANFARKKSAQDAYTLAARVRLAF